MPEGERQHMSLKSPKRRKGPTSVALSCVGLGQRINKWIAALRDMVVVSTLQDWCASILVRNHGCTALVEEDTYETISWSDALLRIGIICACGRLRRQWALGDCLSRR